MTKQVMECVFCGKEITWSKELIVEGNHGEPVYDIARRLSRLRKIKIFVDPNSAAHNKR
ncbi:hypothetical protein AB3N04_00310 (plasmid) [Alkalihalophilus sp. As8PL]|uniref:Uncharacterized protein n=1 Tax=Alkalihalophilus sp. As8PL TaxID=3237103 RepID=A0AB39BP21_9BACI